jgi:hypothetical protein
MRALKVLIACEESQRVCLEFRRRGHEAYSNDLIECSGGHPEWHLQMDAMEAIHSQKWDLLIGHPPCTYLTNAGIGYFNIEKWGEKAKERMRKRDDAFAFFMRMWNSPIQKMCLENPVGWLNSRFRKPNQTIHPHYFGDADLKRTCLWLRGLSRLNGSLEAAAHRTHMKPEPIAIHERKPSKYYNGGEIKKRYFTDAGTRDAKERSKTFPGIARAMAQQWSPDLGNIWNL